MGFRPTPEIREKLERAARANGRSMSQEIEERLGQSFEVDRIALLEAKIDRLISMAEPAAPYAYGARLDPQLVKFLVGVGNGR